MANIGTLVATLGVNARPLVTAGTKMRAFTQSAERGFGRVTKSVFNLRNAMIALGSVYAVQRMARSFIEASNQQEKAVAGLRQAMISMERYTPKYMQSILDTAATYQKLSTYGDEAIIAGTKFLMTYRDIGDRVMPRAMMAMLDLAALMEGDMRRAANMVGKAAMGMTGELRRVGITVDQDTYKTQGFLGVLAQIEEQVGGQARALRNTGYGGMMAFGNLVGDVREKIGDFIKMGIAPFAEALVGPLDDINKRMQAWLDTNEALIKTKVPEYLEKMVRGFGGVMVAVGKTALFIEQNRAMAEYGIVGWLVWGKKGAAIGASIGWLNERLEETSEKVRSLSKELEKGSAIDWLKVPPSARPSVWKPTIPTTEPLEKQISIIQKTAEAFIKTGETLENYTLKIKHSAARTRDWTTSMQGAADMMVGQLRPALVEGAEKLSNFYEDLAQAPIAMADNYLKGLDLFDAAMGTVEDRTTETFGFIEKLSQRTAWSMQTAFSNFFFSTMKGEFDSLKDVGRGFAEAMMRTMADLMSQMLLYQAFGEGFMTGTGGIGGWIGKIFGLQHGGLIREPVVGIGRSGRGYAIGEKGPEWVVPASMPDVRAQRKEEIAQSIYLIDERARPPTLGPNDVVMIVSDDISRGGVVHKTMRRYR